MVVLVTGASGQLGQCLQLVAKKYPQLNFCFLNSAELNVTDFENCRVVFNKIKPDFCINTAAYTAVDKAEIEPEKAHLVNVVGSQNLAKSCKEFNSVMLHVSTDFVFDGNKSTPYTEKDIPNPTSVYGHTKLFGEKAIEAIWEKHYIIRTSWVYSKFGHNFMKTMLRLAAERDSIAVVNDQIGTPTHAIDLAEALVKMILTNAQQYGIYNFSNEGECSWFDFAKEIFDLHGSNVDLRPIATANYPTLAKRPNYSVLDKKKLKEILDFEINNWKISLRLYL